MKAALGCWFAAFATPATAIVHGGSSVRRAVEVGGVALLCAVLLACGGMTLGATEPNFAKAQQASSDGATLFAAKCASCHGQRGEGTGSAPSVMGAGALQQYPRDATESQHFTDPQAIQTQVRAQPPGTPSREPFNNAQDVFGYLKSHMPELEAGSLSDDECWAVLTFLLTGHGIALPPDGVNQANAQGISVQP